MKKWSVLLVAALLLVSGPAWAKGHGNGHGGRPAGESAPPAGTMPPGLARQGKTPKGLEQQGKTPEGWSHGKKRGWWERIFGGHDDDASEPSESAKPEEHQKPQKTR